MTDAVAHNVRRGPLAETPDGYVTLTYDARMLRRKRLALAGSGGFMADLPEVVSLNAGDAFVLTDGRLIAVQAAPEPLMEVRGDLARLAWHIGNRHAPCQIEPDRIVLQRDKVMRGMLEGLGARVADVIEAFTPEGGAYGHGRTMGHDHGHKHGRDDHDHSDTHHHHES